MQYDAVYEYCEGSFPFQNMHIEDIGINQSSKVVSGALLWHQQDNQSRHSVGLRK
jgi:hypothetical protein